MKVKIKIIDTFFYDIFLKLMWHYCVSFHIFFIFHKGKCTLWPKKRKKTKEEHKKKNEIKCAHFSKSSL